MTATEIPTRYDSPTEVSASPTRFGGRHWALWGTGAAVFGGIATLIPSKVNMQPDNHATSATVIASLHRWPYQVAVVAGLFAVACMLASATGWRRWAAERAPGNLAAETVGKALGATAGAMMIGFGMLGSLAVYLHGGINQHMFSRDGLFSIYMFVDFAPYVAWWGATVAAAALAWIAFRNRLVPRWIGAVSALAVAIAVLPMLLAGLPGMPGVVGPFWLFIVSLGMYRQVRSA